MQEKRPVALVFGASRGIGASCAAAFVEAGWRVAGTHTGRKTSGSDDSFKQVAGYQVDIRDAASVASVFDKVEADYGCAPTSVVVNAGINVPPSPVASFPTERFRELIEVNLIGAFNVLAEAARRVADGGSITALSTSMVRVAVPGGGPYTATKAAVESLVRSMSKELAGRRVRVNAVAPGPVDTDLFRAGKNEDALARSAAMSPFGRVGQPEEVARAVLFVSSEAASWVSGQVIQPNGGMV